MIVPAVRVEVVIASGAAFTVRVNCRVALCADPSVTCAVKLEVPTAVGVPDNTPPAESATPAGNVPAVSDQLKGARPPAANSVVEYGVLRVALGKFCVDTLNVVALTVNWNCRATTCEVESVSDTEKTKAPI